MWKLTQLQTDTILRCLRAAIEGPFFDEAEFQTLMGMDRGGLRSLVARWPVFDDETATAVHNVLGNLLWYPHHFAAELRERFGVHDEDMRRILDVLSEAI